MKRWNRILTRTSKTMAAAAVALEFAVTAVAQVPNQPMPPVVPVPAAAQAGDAHLACQMAWLADPATFQLNLAVKTTKNGLEVSGFVPTESVKARVLQIAREVTGVSVQDGMKVHGQMPLHMPKKVSPAELCEQVRQRLSEEFGEQAKEIRVSGATNGKIVLEGTLTPDLDRMSVAKCLRSVEGCTHVVNRLGPIGLARPMTPPAFAQAGVTLPPQTRPMPVPPGSPAPPMVPQIPPQPTPPAPMIANQPKPTPGIATVSVPPSPVKKPETSEPVAPGTVRRPTASPPAPVAAAQMTAPTAPVMPSPTAMPLPPLPAPATMTPELPKPVAPVVAAIQEKPASAPMPLPTPRNEPPSLPPAVVEAAAPPLASPARLEHAIKETVGNDATDVKLRVLSNQQVAVSLKVRSAADWEKVYPKLKALPEATGYTMMYNVNTGKAPPPPPPTTAAAPAPLPMPKAAELPASTPTSQTAEATKMGVIRPTSAELTPAANPEAVRAAIEKACQHDATDLKVKSIGDKRISVQLKVNSAGDWDKLYKQIKEMPEVNGYTVIFNVSVRS